MLLLTTVQVAKAAEALAAKTEELAAKAAAMDTLQQRFDEEHAELEELQAGDWETQVGGRKFGLLVLQERSQQAQQAVASAVSVDTCASCIPPCWCCTSWFEARPTVKAARPCRFSEVRRLALSQVSA